MRIRARVGLGDGKGAEHLAAYERTQPAFSLFGGAGRPDRLGHERVADREDDRNRRTVRRDGFDRQRVRNVIEAGAAPLGRHRNADETKRRRLRHERTRIDRRPVDLGRERLDPIARKRGGTIDKGLGVGGDGENPWRGLGLRAHGSGPRQNF